MKAILISLTIILVLFLFALIIQQVVFYKINKKDKKRLKKLLRRNDNLIQEAKDLREYINNIREEPTDKKEKNENNES